VATRVERIAHFHQGEPPAEVPLELLCEDGSGTYLLPFNCQWSDGSYRKLGSEKPLTAKVVGWKIAPQWRKT
jgi:hypothetical protein